MGKKCTGHKYHAEFLVLFQGHDDRKNVFFAEKPKSYHKIPSKTSARHRGKELIGNQSPKCIIRSGVPLRCPFYIIKFKNAAGQQPS